MTKNQEEKIILVIIIIGLFLMCAWNLFDILTCFMSVLIIAELMKLIVLLKGGD